MKDCKHIEEIKQVRPSSGGCEECVEMGDYWVHLRVCMECGHVGCCDDSKNKHATQHFHKTQHPIIFSFEPEENWGYCYIDDLMFETPRPFRNSKKIDLNQPWSGEAIR